jgi:hypothetical protein
MIFIKYNSILKKWFLATSFILITSGIVFSQDKIRSALDSLQKFPEEKIYLLYDKAQYTSGETIWFSAFVFSDYELSPYSTNLFIELFDKEKKLIAGKALPVFNGQAGGQIALPPKLDEDIYFLRAYTKWMLNFPEDRQYIHPIEILNPNSPKKLQRQNIPWKAEAFPEGGNLLDSAICKVAVRLFSPAPLPDNWNASVSEIGTDSILGRFTAIDPNVCIVTLIPFAGHEYQITVQHKGAVQVLKLPPVLSSGVHLEVENLNDNILYRLYLKNAPVSNLKLVATMNSQLVYEAEIKKGDGIINQFIPLKDVPNGILQLSVIENDDHMLAERLCFARSLSIAIDTPIFSSRVLNLQPRAETFLELKPDTVLNPYSVLILDADSNNQIDKDNLLSALWLTSDVFRPIERPAQYFTHTNENTEKGLDAILISETWKRFNWNDILHFRYPNIKYLPDRYLSYKGIAYKDNKLLANQDLNLVVNYPDSSKDFVQFKTDDKGSFTMSNILFYDSAKVFFQTSSKKTQSKNISIQFEELTKHELYAQSLPINGYMLIDRPANELPPIALTINNDSTLNNQSVADKKYKELAEVRVLARKKTDQDKLENELSTNPFRGYNETIFDFVNEDQHIQGYTNILTWMEGRVNGLYFMRNSAGDVIPYIRNSPTSIYIDETLTDASRLDGFPVTEIAMIKIIRGYFVGDVEGRGNGGILIYTKRGNMGGSSSEPSLNSAVLRGYPRPIDYPIPNYKNANAPKIDHDTRKVLFWNPFVFAKEKDLKIPIRFYNNDSAKQFRVIINGFTSTGLPVYYDELMK